MKVTICYFSGTGNTEYASKLLAEKFSSVNSVECFSIEENKSVPEDTDLLLVGGPIYAGNVPEKLIRWVLRNIPDAKTGAGAVPFSTSAGLLNAFGVKSLAKKLSNKGYQVITVSALVMPRNYYFDKYEKMSEEISSELIKKTDNDIEKLISDLDLNSSVEIDKSTLGIDLLAETMSVMTRFMGKNFKAGENCIRCGKCVKKCPQNNIKLGKKLTFGWSCMMCTRCIHGCPVNAIEYKGKSYPQYRVNEIVKWKINE